MEYILYPVEERRGEERRGEERRGEERTRTRTRRGEVFSVVSLNSINVISFSGSGVWNALQLQCAVHVIINHGFYLTET